MFRTKDDRSEHEEINYTRRFCLCQLPECAVRSQETVVKFRKEHFKKHMELYHMQETFDELEIAKSCITMDSIFECECLFHGCNVLLHTWKDRINQIAKHFSTQYWYSWLQ